MSTVNFDAVDVRYSDGHQALSEISLDIHDGEFIALVGPSGSGKTTLLRSLAGFLDPATGTISIEGQKVASPGHSTPVEQRGLGMVFQQHALWPHMSVAENIGYPLKLAGVRKPDRSRRITDVLELLGLESMERRRPDQLSGGQRQRVALGRAIINEPRVLLLDEALSALDEPLRANLRFQLQSMSKRLGLTVVHVTHDRSEALAIADRIVVLDGGRIQQIATPSVIVERPGSPFVAQFLNDATLIPGTMEGHTFRAGKLPLTVKRSAISPKSPDTDTSATGVLAVTPNHVVFTHHDNDRDPAAEVVSSLYGRHAHSVEVHWKGQNLRGETSGWQPAPGSHVGVDIIGGTFFPEPHQTPNQSAPAPIPAGASLP